MGLCGVRDLIQVAAKEREIRDHTTPGNPLRQLNIRFSTATQKPEV